MELYNVRVVDALEDFYFSVCSLCVNVVAKCAKYFFKGVGFAIKFIFNSPNVSIGSTTDEFSNFVTFENVFLYFFGHLNIMSIQTMFF